MNSTTELRQAAYWLRYLVDVTATLA